MTTNLGQRLDAGDREDVAVGDAGRKAGHGEERNDRAVVRQSIHAAACQEATRCVFASGRRAQFLQALQRDHRGFDAVRYGRASAAWPLQREAFLYLIWAVELIAGSSVSGAQRYKPTFAEDV
jgi:hypothetical protein